NYGSGDGQFLNPVRVAVSANGNLLVADSLADRVQVFSPGIALSSLAISPTHVPGGNPAQGTLMMSSSAPPEGMDIPLPCDHTIVGVPNSLHIEGGSDTATFDISTVPVLTDTTAHFSATYAGVTRAAYLLVSAPVLTNLVLDPPAVPGGATSTATVTLDGPA